MRFKSCGSGLVKTELGGFLASLQWRLVSCTYGTALRTARCSMLFNRHLSTALLCNLTFGS